MLALPRRGNRRYGAFKLVYVSVDPSTTSTRATGWSIDMGTFWRCLFPKPPHHSASPPPSIVDPEKEAERLIVAGHPMEDRGEFEAALASYMKAVEVSPNSARAHMN